MSDFLDDLASGVGSLFLGEDPKEARKRGLGEQLAGAPSRGIEAGAMFSQLGDVQDLQAGITGEFAGEEIPLWQRLLGVFGSSGVFVGAVIPTGNLMLRRRRMLEAALNHPYHSTEAARLGRRGGGIPDSIRRLMGADQWRRGLTFTDEPLNPNAQIIAGLNRSAPDDDILYGTLGRFTARVTQLDDNGDDWGHLARGVRDIGDVSNMSDAERRAAELAATPSVKDRQQATRSSARKGLFANYEDAKETERAGLFAKLEDAKTAPDAPMWVDLASGRLRSLGSRLVAEVDEHRMGTALYNSPLDAEHRSAAYELARFHNSIKNGRLQGKGVKKTEKLWSAFRAGEDIGPDGWKTLEDAIVRHADITQPFMHPEFALHPALSLSKVNLETGAASLKVLPFHRVTLDRASEKLMNDRLSAMLSTDSGRLWFSETVAENYRRFFDEYVTVEDIDNWKDWYPQARADLERVAGETGFNSRKLVAIASIVSAGETWETNVPKAVEVAKLIQREVDAAGTNRKGLVDRIKRLAGSELNVKMSGDDTIRAMIVQLGIAGDNIDDQVDDFFQGVTGVRPNKAAADEARAAGFLAEGEKPLKLKGIKDRFEAGDDMVALIYKRQLANDFQSLKQPSFDDAIWRSTEDDVLDRALAMARIMTGDLGFDVNPGDTVRRLLPVVSDRQAFKIGIGFSMNPGTWFSSNRGGYDAMSQGIRLAAAQLSEATGRFITPEQLQAITWMSYRDAAQVSSKIPGVVDQDTSIWRRGWRIDSKAKAGWGSDLGGPALSLGYRNVTDVLLGTDNPVGMVPVAAYKSMWKNLEKTLGKQDLARASKGGLKGFDVNVQLNPDGTFAVGAASDASLPSNAYLTPFFDDDGFQIFAPSRPTRVQNTQEYLTDTVASTARDDLDPSGGMLGNIGGTIVPSVVYDRITETLANGEGVTWWALPLKDNSDNVIDPRALIAERLEALRNRGVNVSWEFVETPHTGYSTPLKHADRDELVWGADPVEVAAEPEKWSKVADLEQRQGVLIFGDTEQIATYLRTPDVEGTAVVSGTAARQQAAKASTADGPTMLAEPNTAYERDPWKGQLMAEAYERMPVVTKTPEWRAAYDSFTRETVDQALTMTRDEGIVIKFVDEDPYPNMEAMFADVRDNRQLLVFKTQPGDHPVAGEPLDLSVFDGKVINTSDTPPMLNDLFRAVHDYYGHYAISTNFGRNGEDIAWAHHAAMYSDEAVPAMTMESRAQNSALIYSRSSRQADLFKKLIANESTMVDEANRLLDEGNFDLPRGPAVLPARADSVDGQYVRLFRSFAMNPDTGEELLSSADDFAGDQWFANRWWTTDPTYAMSFGPLKVVDWTKKTGGVRPEHYVKEIVLPRAVYDRLNPEADELIGFGSSPSSTRFVPAEIEEIFGSVAVDRYTGDWYDDHLNRSVQYNLAQRGSETWQPGATRYRDGDGNRVRWEPLTLTREQMSTDYEFAPQKAGIPPAFLMEDTGALVFNHRMPATIAHGGGLRPVEQVPEVLVFTPDGVQPPGGYRRAHIMSFTDGDTVGWTATTRGDDARPNTLKVFAPYDGGQGTLFSYIEQLESKLTSPGTREFQVVDAPDGTKIVDRRAAVAFASPRDLKTVEVRTSLSGKDGLDSAKFEVRKRSKNGKLLKTENFPADQVEVTVRDGELPQVTFGHSTHAPLKGRPVRGETVRFTRASKSSPWKPVNAKVGDRTLLRPLEEARVVLEELGSRKGVQLAGADDVELNVETDVDGSEVV